MLQTWWELVDGAHHIDKWVSHLRMAACTLGSPGHHPVSARSENTKVSHAFQVIYWLCLVVQQ